MNWNFIPLDQINLDLSKFDCEDVNLNDYLNKYSLQNHTIGLSKCYIATDNYSTILGGYYAISNSIILPDSVDKSLKKGLPNYAYPTVLIGRLAVDKNFKGQGLGKRLLVDAFKRILRIEKDIGIFAVMVDAKNDNAKDFYLNNGFIQFLDKPLSLFLPLSILKKSVSL